MENKNAKTVEHILSREYRFNVPLKHLADRLMKLGNYFGDGYCLTNAGYAKVSDIMGILLGVKECYATRDLWAVEYDVQVQVEGMDVDSKNGAVAKLDVKIFNAVDLKKLRKELEELNNKLDMLYKVDFEHEQCADELRKKLVAMRVESFSNDKRIKETGKKIRELKDLLEDFEEDETIRESEWKRSHDHTDDFEEDE